MMGADSSHPNFIPERYQIAVCQRTERVNPFDEELVHGAPIASVSVHPLSIGSGVREAPITDCNKRYSSNDMPDIVDCKRLKQDDRIISKVDSYTSDAAEDVHDCLTHACQQGFDSLACEIEENEDEGVDSPVHFALADNCVDDDIWPANFHHSASLCLTRKPIPIGLNHQAELPECRPFGGTEEDGSDKWISNCVIPMPHTDALSSVLKPVYLKAGCDCVAEDSINCVRKHVREARETLKVSLGADIFKELGLDDMGEDVASRWTEEEEHLFQQVVLSNPASLRRNFWDELPRALPSKSSKELVSYYFNVFMLRKRAQQNRFDPTSIDSDDDEWQIGCDGELAIKERACEYLPTESLIDQDDGACNQVPLDGHFYEDSDEQNELDNASGDKHDGMQGSGMSSEFLPAMSSMDHNQQTFKSDADAHDDSCASFGAHQVGIENGAHTDLTQGHHYQNDGFSGVPEHGYFSEHCDTKEWEIGFTSGWEKDDFFATNNVIEEVVGKPSCQDGSNAATGQDII